MLVNRRVNRDAGGSSRVPLSTAQFLRTARTYKTFQHPANRFKAPSLTSCPSSQSAGTRTQPPWTAPHSDNVIFPPVHRSSPKISGSLRRPVNRGCRKLPKVDVKDGANSRQLAWYHDDGSINLEALSALVKRHSCPRTKSYYDRLHGIHGKNSSRQRPGTGPSRSEDDNKLVPLCFLDDDHLTPKERQERDSFLATLLNSEDLSEEDLDKIAYYLVAGDFEDEEEDGEGEVGGSSVQPSSMKKSPRPKSSTGKNTVAKNQSREQRKRHKTVRFLHTSPSPVSDEETTSSPTCLYRPHSAPTGCRPTLAMRRPSDPFHVASPLCSPRSVSSPDEVAYFRKNESPIPEVPASPTPLAEPKVVYYDDSGEEICEDIQGEEKERGKKRSDQPSPSGDAEVPDHLPELDTPRVERDTRDTQTSPRSKPHSSSSLSPVLHGQPSSGISESLHREPSSEQSSPTPAESLDRHLDNQKTGSPVREEDGHSEDPSDRQPPTDATASPSPETNPPKKKDSAPEKEESHCKSLKKSKRSKKSRSGESSRRGKQTPSSHNADADAPPGSGGSADKAGGTRDAALRVVRNDDDDDDNECIPVISLTRGQLPAVPTKPPRIQTPDAPRSSDARNPDKPEESASLSMDISKDSLNVKQSPRTSKESRLKVKDDRMKIWLTRTAWNRHMDCVEIECE